MTNQAAELAEIIKEIEEIDTCIVDLEADARRDPSSNQARHNKFACKALRRYRVRLVDQRDALLGAMTDT